jgi:GT2 family glycosyltransferase
MQAELKNRCAVVLPIGPGKVAALDTLASIEFYCPEPHMVVLVDDCTQDGTYETLCAQRRPNWHILRNDRAMGVRRLVHSLCRAYRFVLSETQCSLVLRLDQDALLIGSGVISDAALYANLHPSVGLFGVYTHDYNRPRSFDMHAQRMRKELSWPRRMFGLTPSWRNLLAMAEGRGYHPGENVFGGAYFVTRECLEAMSGIGALDVEFQWHSRLMEDVYFSMAAVAAGFDLGHFAAPEGPLCLEWRGLPYPASELAKTGYKVVHSVDKGQNTDRGANGGKTAREVFQELRLPRDSKIIA